MEMINPKQKSIKANCFNSNYLLIFVLIGSFANFDCIVCWMVNFFMIINCLT